jgi:hypothetical protein
MCAAPARGRLVWAAAGSLMLHAVGLAVLWRTLVPHVRLACPPESRVPPPAMLWVALAPTPAPAPAPAFYGSRAGRNRQSGWGAHRTAGGPKACHGGHRPAAAECARAPIHWQALPLRRPRPPPCGDARSGPLPPRSRRPHLDRRQWCARWSGRAPGSAGKGGPMRRKPGASEAAIVTMGAGAVVRDLRRTWGLTHHQGVGTVGRLLRGAALRRPASGHGGSAPHGSCAHLSLTSSVCCHPIQADHLCRGPSSRAAPGQARGVTPCLSH